MEKNIGGITIDEDRFSDSFNLNYKGYIIDEWKEKYWKDTTILSALDNNEFDLLFCSNSIFGGVDKRTLVMMLLKANIPFLDYMTKIPEGLFWHFDFITKVDIPDNIKSIGTEAFKGCSSLSVLNLGKGVKEIGLQAFVSCDLSQIIIPGNVKSIGASAFFNNPAWAIKIEEGCEEIGWQAFVACMHVSVVELPKSLKKVDTWAFDRVGINPNRYKDRLKIINYNGTKEDLKKIIGYENLFPSYHFYHNDKIHQVKVRLSDGTEVTKTDIEQGE